MRKRLLAMVLALSMCFSGMNTLAVYANQSTQEIDIENESDSDVNKEDGIGDESDIDVDADTGVEGDTGAEGDTGVEGDTDADGDTGVEDDADLEDDKENTQFFNAISMMGGIRVDDSRAFYYGNIVLTGWISVDGVTYYLDENGQLYTGLANKGIDTYCIKEGQIVTGWQIVDGAEYYFDTDGIMLKDCVIDGITLGADGKSVYPECVIEDGLYLLSAYDSGYVAGVPGSVKEDGTQVVLEEYTYKESQQYRISNVEDEWYKIENVHSGKVLSAGYDSNESGISVEQKPYTGIDGQLWKFIEYRDGNYYIISKLGTVLSCMDAALTAGTPLYVSELIHEVSQRWNIGPVIEPQVLNIADGTYQFTGYNSFDKIIVADGYSVDNYVAMKLNVCFGYEGESYDIEALGDGWYSIKNAYSGLSVDSAGGADDTVLLQCAWNNSSSQMWRFIDAGNGRCYIQSKAGTVLTRANGSTENGVSIQMSTLDYSDAQIWTVEEPKVPKTLEIQNGAEYLIVSALDVNRVVDIADGSTADGANIQLKRESLTSTQRFRAVEIESDWYKLESIYSGKVIEIAGNGSSGSNVQQNIWKGTDIQLWRFIDAGDGNCYIQSKNGMVMNCASSPATDGTNINAVMPGQSINQKFQMCNTSAANYIHVTTLTEYVTRITLYNPDVANIQSVSFPTWSAENGQDDIVWVDGIHVAENVWAVEIDTRNYKGQDWFVLVTHIYANTPNESYFIGVREYWLKAHLEGWIYVDGFRRYRNEDGTIRNDVSDIFNPSSKYITVDRIKGITTIYGYNSETNAYDTPIKSMWCSVGNPISLTRAGTYSMGWQLKKKEMNASDGSYRCWASYVSQIYGAVYFHGVASDTPDLNTISAGAFRTLGSPASHGCVRLAAIDARWIYYNTGTGTRIKVGDNMAAPLVPTRYDWVGGAFGPDPTYF